MSLLSSLIDRAEGKSAARSRKRRATPSKPGVVVDRRAGFGGDAGSGGESESLLSTLLGAAERGEFGYPSPTHFMRRPPKLPVYRVRLEPLEHHALSCLLIIGCSGKGNPLVDSVCDQLDCHDRSYRGRVKAVRSAYDLGMLRGERIVGTSDLDLSIAQVLIEPIRQSADLTMRGVMPFVFPRFRPKRYHLQALCDALSDRELHGRLL